MDWTRLQWKDNDKVVLPPCFELVATSTAPLVDGRPGFLRFYAEFLDRFGNALTSYATGTMTSWRKPNAKALQIVPSWLSDPRNLAKPDFSIEFHSGPSVVEMMPPSLRLSFDVGGSYISMAVPPELVSDDATQALDLVRSAVGKDFALATGWGGNLLLAKAAWRP